MTGAGRPLTGQRSATAEEQRARYDGCKSFLHGSDAHDRQSVGQPGNDRFSRIKGGLVADALCQACIDPAGRALVSEPPPRSTMPSQVISHVKMGNAGRAAMPEIQPVRA